MVDGKYDRAAEGMTLCINGVMFQLTTYCVNDYGVRRFEYVELPTPTITIPRRFTNGLVNN